MRQVQHLAKTCQTFGIGLSMHSNSHLGISLLAMTHVAATTHHLSYACDTHYPWQSEQDEIAEGGRITIRNGEVLIPESGGLGAKLDYDQIARGKELYRSIPYRKRDDEAEMQKYVDPDWKRILPRW
jgi:glucarate dehydratase